MSMTFHRLDRKDILEELYWIGERMNYPKSEVISINKHGARAAIIKVEEKANGVFVFPFEAGNPILALAPFFGSKMYEYDLGDFVAALEECTHDDVWLQWPTDKPHTVIGKILGIGHGDTLTVNLTPVPKDIEEINERVRLMASEKCEVAKAGTQCGDCPKLTGCAILKEVDEKITADLG